MRRIFVAASLILFVAALSLHAQTTGEIIGKITDEQGGALPGVTVEVKGPALQGSRSNVTDTKGDYRLVLLPPGTYTLTATLAGFAQVQRTVTVSLAKTATELVTLRPSTPRRSWSRARRRSWTRRRRRSARISTAADQDAADRPQLRVRRARRAGRHDAGFEHRAVLEHDRDLRIVRPGEQLHHRRRRHERRRVRRPGQGAQLRVHPGGRRQDRRLPGRVRAVDGRHHQRHHQVGRQRVPRRRVRLLQRELLAGRQPAPDENLYGTNLGFSQYDWGLDAGGYIWKDRIWFFGAYDRVKNTQTNALSSGPLVGEEFASDTVRNLGSGKLT
jgi:hypothetical protein